MESVRARVPDLIRFIAAVFALNKCLVRTAYFLKHFMSVHHKSDNWVQELAADNTIKGQFLWGEHPNPDLVRVPVVPLTTGGASLGDGSESRKRGRDRGSGNRRERRQNGGQAKTTKKFTSNKFCRSRTNPASVCTHDPCIYSHECASCGQDHPASQCPAFDVAKAKAAARNR